MIENLIDLLYLFTCKVVFSKGWQVSIIFLKVKYKIIFYYERMVIKMNDQVELLKLILHHYNNYYVLHQKNLIIYIISYIMILNKLALFKLYSI